MKPRRPWLALLASLVPPLGHFYVGRPVRGVVLAVVAFLVAAGAAVLSLRLESLGLFVFAALAQVVVPIDAYRLARRVGASYRLRPCNRWFVYVGVWIVAAIVGNYGGVGLRGLVKAYKLPSAAMEPTLLIGDHILVDKLAYRGKRPERFDVVVFQYPKDPSKDFIKRVIGLPGETVELRDGAVWIDGAPLEDPYSHPVDPASREPMVREMPAREVPEGSYFMLGDKRDHSYDSRFWGPLAADAIRGQVRMIYWSFASGDGRVRWDRIGRTVE